MIVASVLHFNLTANGVLMDDGWLAYTLYTVGLL